MNKRQKREKRRKDCGIVNLMRIQEHFFGEFRKWIEEMQNPRNPGYITYTQLDLIYMGLLKI